MYICQAFLNKFLSTLKPLLIQVEADLIERNFVAPWDKVMSGISFGKAGSKKLPQNLHDLAQGVPQ
jgi:hypothetical protein